MLGLKIFGKAVSTFSYLEAGHSDPRCAVSGDYLPMIRYQNVSLFNSRIDDVVNHGDRSQISMSLEAPVFMLTPAVKNI